MNIMKLGLCVIATGSFLVGSDVAYAEPENLAVCAACHGDDGSGAGYLYVPIMADKLKELDQGKIDALIHYYSSWDPES